jgi:hypothetical protein
MSRLAVALGLACLLTGCVASRQKGGSATFVSPNATIGVQQSENPKDATIQEIERITERIPIDDPSVVIRTTERIKTRIGGAQKDLIGESMAKLRNLRPVMFLGVAVFLFGVASAFWPLLKVVVGSVTTSAAIAAAGLALIILPTVIVGNEILIIVGTLGIAVAYWFAHRHGELRGAVKALNGDSK